MTQRVTFGVDPGLSGAIATLIDGEPGPILDMPTRMVGDWNEVDAHAAAEWIREQRRAHAGAHFSACIEKVGAMPSDGATSAFRFGESSGKIKAVFESLGIPAVWKRRFGLLGQDKDAARLLAIARFPSVADQLKRKKDGGRADALLLALYHEHTANGLPVAA